MGKKNFLFLLISFVLMSSTLIFAQDTTKVKDKKKNQTIKFVDKNGDGYNDNAPDHDGDGIPDCLDPDWLKNKQRKHPAFQDLDGDGINDLMQNGGKKQHGFPGGNKPRIRFKNPGQHKHPFKMKGKK